LLHCNASFPFLPGTNELVLVTRCYFAFDDQ
jgi:hypothetical protein